MSSAPVFGVSPPSARVRLATLFDQLEAALALEFRPDASGSTGPVVRVGGDAIAPGPSDRPSLQIIDRSLGSDAAAVRLSFAGEEAGVDRAYASRTLAHTPLEPLDFPELERFQVMAQLDSGPVWLRHGTTEVVASSRDLEKAIPLRARLGSDSYLPLVALVQFIRRHHPAAWQPPPIGSTFLFDDPNLHSVRYGHLDFRELVKAGGSVGFHTAMALIPLDAWFASARAVSLFRDHRLQLSLLIHGSNHLRRELATTDRRRAAALLAIALQRIERFEQRYRLSVDRVIAPPHGACSYEAAEAIHRSGIEALCVSRPYPWASAPPADRPLAGWRPTEIVAGGLPVLPRVRLGADERELATRAFLRQPLILYGHHQDAAEGIGILERSARTLDSLGADLWRSPVAILRRLYDSRREGDVLAVRPHSRRVAVEIPPGVDRVRISIDPLFEVPAVAVHGAESTEDGSFALLPHTKTVRVELPSETADLLRDGDIPRVVPYGRRALTEARDRLAPVFAKLR